MTPLDRLRLEKAATDCGFEMTATEHDDGLELRSARFPEVVTVRKVGASGFEVSASSGDLVSGSGATGVVIVDGYELLYDTLQKASAHARTLPNRVADAFRRETAQMPRATEAERLVVQRVGQDLFRSALLDFWQGRRCVTGLSVPELLRASHIKPWSKCENDNERLDVFNGLLLAPQLDALFDGGWISFTEAGALLVSEHLPIAALEALGVATSCTIRELKPAHMPYLAFHRANELRSPTR